MKTQTGFTFLTTLIGLPIFLGILLLGSVPALAATITVNSVSDNTTQDGYCTLREAIENAQGVASHADCIPGTGGGDDIIFQVTAPATINLTGVLPVIRKNVNLLNQTGKRLTVRRDTGGDYRLFKVNSGATVTIEGLTIENGLANGTDNRGGGVYNAGTLTLKNSTVQGNQANYGGGIANTGTSATLILTQSTVSNNSLLSVDGYLSGAGIFNKGGKITITNSTISGNTTPDTVWAGGAGLYNGSSGTVEIINSTISKNAVLSVSSTGGGLVNNGGVVVTVKNTIIAGNSAVSYYPDVYGDITGNNYNLIGDLSGNTGTLGTGTDIVSSSPLLGTLSYDNGGLVETQALLVGSPAIDAGNNTLAAGLTFDQRCVPRIAGTAVDIGAYEVSSPLVSYDFQQPTFTIPEGNDVHTFSEVVINRTGDLSLASTVDMVLTGGGTTTAGLISVQFMPCQDSQVVIEIRGNTIQETDKKVELSFANFSGGRGQAGITQPTATLTITDDDGATIEPPPPPPPPPPIPTPPTPLPPPAGFSSMPAPSSTIVFDNTLLGATSTQSLRIKNTGGTPLIINNLTGITGTNKYDFQVLSPSFPLSIYPDNPERTVTVQCNPRGTGIRTATLELTSSDPKNPTPTYFLQCTGTQPKYSSTPTPNSTLKFGSSEVGKSLTLELSIAETGNATLEVNLDSLGGANASEFKVLSPTFPLTIPDGGSEQKVTVQCTPADVSLRTATLKLHNNDPKYFPNGIVSYFLQCTGTKAGYVSRPASGSILKLGSSEIGKPISLAVVSIGESGNAPLTVSLEFLSGINASDFTIVSPSLPLTIADGGGSQAVTVQCTPSAEGLRTATLTLHSNDPSNLAPTYTLACTGILPLPVSPLVGDPTAMNGGNVSPPPSTEPKLYTLTITIQGNGKVTFNEKSECEPNCTESYPSNTPVTLKAMPAEGWQFDGWQEDCDGNGMVMMSDNRTCQATFSPLPLVGSPQSVPELILTISVEGNGQVTLNNNVECGTGCQQSYPKDTLVMPQATPNEGWQFDGWQGDCETNGSVTMDTDHACTAIFSAIPSYILQVRVEGGEGGEGGKITSLPAGIDCGMKCNASYLNNTPVTLSAIANDGWRLVQWGGECDAHGNVTMTTDHTCTARFASINHTLTIAVNGGGKVNTPNGIECKNSCTDIYANGTTVTLTYSLEPGAKFKSWGKDCDSTGTVSLDQDRVCVAIFVAEDSDGDTITDEEEANAPGQGDGNNDGIPDKDQSNVASFKDSHTGNYVTLAVSSQCNIKEVYQKVKQRSGQDFNSMNFQLNEECQKAEVNLFYYGSNNAFTDAYDKYGPKVSSFLLSHGVSNLPNVVFGSEMINGQLVTKLRTTFNKEKSIEDKYGHLYLKSSCLPGCSFDEDSGINYIDLDRAGVDPTEKKDVCVDWNVLEDTAKPDKDYRVLGVPGPKCKNLPPHSQDCKEFEKKPVCWLAGYNGPQSVAIEMINNAIPNEPAKKFIFSIGNPSPPEARIKGDTFAEVTIVNDDWPACPPDFKVSLDLPSGCNADGQTLIANTQVKTNTQDGQPIPPIPLVRLPAGSRLNNAVFIDTVQLDPASQFYPASRVDEATFKGNVLNMGTIVNPKAFQGMVINTESGTIIGKAEQPVVFPPSSYPVINAGSIENAIFEANVQNPGVITNATIVQNTGVITNATIAEGVSIEGEGMLQGTIINHSTLRDVKLDEATIEGGALQGTISGSGTLKNVRLLPSDNGLTYVTGLHLAGRIEGSQERAAYLKDVTVLSGSHLINVIIDGKVTWPEDRKVTLENVALGAYLHVPGGTLQGHISSDQAEAPAVLENVQILAGCHLTNVVLGEEVTVAKGITLEGIITNQGGNVLEDVQLEGNTVVSEGKLKGNIIGKVAPTKVENQSPVAVLKNLEVLAGSHLNNVTIGKNVILAEDVILENVKLPAHFTMTSGQLQGIILGKEEAPARLDNVTIVAGSYLENVIIGNNVTLAEDVSFGKAVCLGAWGTDALRQPVDTQACFIGHLVVNDMPHTTPAMFANQEMDAVKVAVTIKIDPAHLGKTAEIVIWAEYNSTLVAGKGRKYARDTTCDDKGLCWQLLTNDDPSQLPTAVSYNSLPDTIEVPIYTGRLNGIPGEFTVYAGYRLSDGTLVYNGRKPIHFMVGNSASIDLQQGFRSLTSNDAKKTSYFTPWVKQEEGLARVRVDARDVGKPADILMVAVSRQQYYTRHGDNWQRWDEKLASLQPAQHFAELPGMLAVPIHQERLKEVLSGGDVTVYVGYRLEEDKVIVFNGVAPIHFVVAE